jgi:hypothetical protein
MAKNEKKNAGLQKGISSIFKGVSIPQRDGDRKPSGTSAPERTDYTEPSPPVPEPQKSEAPKIDQASQTLFKADSEQTDYTELKQPISEPQQPQPQETNKPLSEAEPAQQPEDEPVHLPEFMTVQESEAEPEQESEVEPARQPESEPVHLPEFMTVQESEAEPEQESEAEPARQPESEPVHLPGSVPAPQPKVDIDKKVSIKRPIEKISDRNFWQQIINKVSAPKPGATPTRQKAMVVMMPLLLIVLIFMLFKGGVFGTSAGHTETSVEDTASDAVTAGANHEIDWKIPDVYPAKLRDPMRLVESETEQPETKPEIKPETKKTTKLIVKSILYSEDNSSAVISGRILHEGEIIQGAKVVKISRDSVEFEMNGKRWTQRVR